MHNPRSGACPFRKKSVFACLFQPLKKVLESMACIRFIATVGNEGELHFLHRLGQSRSIAQFSTGGHYQNPVARVSH
jgi:hypothetical protein